MLLLALPASAQSPTADDVKRMLEDFDTSHQKTLQMIEQAKAAVRPVSEFAHLPPDAVALEAYVGKPLVSVESGYILQVNRAEQGTPRVIFINVDATPVGGFDLGPRQATATATYSLYDLQQIAFADCPANGKPRTGSVKRDGGGVGFTWSCGGDRSGRGRVIHSYSLEPAGPGIKTTFNVTGEQGATTTSEHVYLPVTEERLAATAARLRERYEQEQRRLAELRAQQAEEERERRRASQERFDRVLGGISSALNEASAEVGTYEDAQDRLDATVAGIEGQAAAQQRSQQVAQQRTEPRAAYAQAPEAGRVAPVQAQPRPQQEPRAAGTSGTAAAPPAAKPLRFVLMMSMRNLPGDTVNPTCYSNVITRDGPPGWGAGGFLPPGSSGQARRTVESLKSAFIAQCRASGREITSEGNFTFVWNEFRDDEQRLGELRAKYREDVSVSL